MDGLDSPMQATLAIDPVSLGPLLSAAVNNLWALIAVVAAAFFSLFRLRAGLSLSATTSSPEPRTTSSPSTTSRAPPTEPNATTSFDGREKSAGEAGVLTRGNSSKELFSARFSYYEDDADVDADGDEEEERENAAGCEGEGGGDVDGGDEPAVKRRARGLTVAMRGAGDLGWYEFQDRRVINGSVVRLWEVERESPRSYRRRSSFAFTPLLST